MMQQAANVTLRALEESDLDFLYALENDPSIWGVSDTLAPVSRFALRQYLQHATADWYEVRQMRLVICVAEKSVGTLDLFNFEPLHQRAGVGITILAEVRRQGYAQAALELLLGYARHTLRLHQLYCTVAADNTASLQLFEQAGFRQVGVRKEWLRKDFFWQDAVELQYILETKYSGNE
ncbi:GNAT family N-acetyltransferase [Hymenobacter cellulosilyticus]|uniref:GNAT family N-acetyltransferase n=1 Tax=Hymenobacter cellulosilyticus TaxID=2932248 RepID=A0A8T9Q9G7_9BACT|nr:GNAT family N-acetyltransferase [Hymenobacter cellulosilyticus]UOQ72460.1 GNAT family N-acetyltransferase [Hymenobacter cellulosilyticus]